MLGSYLQLHLQKTSKHQNDLLRLYKGIVDCFIQLKAISHRSDSSIEKFIVKELFTNYVVLMILIHSRFKKLSNRETNLCKKTRNSFCDRSQESCCEIAHQIPSHRRMYRKLTLRLCNNHFRTFKCLTFRILFFSRNQNQHEIFHERHFKPFFSSALCTSL